MQLQTGKTNGSQIIRNNMKQEHLSKLEALVENEGINMPAAYKQWYAIDATFRKLGYDRGLESHLHQTKQYFAKPFYKPISMYSILIIASE
jgi:hypothetical protein